MTLARFVGALAASRTVKQLEQSFLAGFGRALGVPMYGLTGLVAANVSDSFVARYEAEVRKIDPVLGHAGATGRPAYNLELMTAAEWERSAAYQRAYRMHRIRHVVHVPVPGADSLFLAGSATGFDTGQIALAEVLAGVIGDTLARIRAQERMERAAAALDLAATPLVTCDPEPRLNAAARRLLAEVVDGEACLHRLIARPGAFARRLDVELAGGESARLHAASTMVAGGLVTVLQLERERPALAPLVGLTPRETEVARLVVDGLADREIAERLQISHYTVSQYVKRIYRKLSVDSRVALTRLALRPLA